MTSHLDPSELIEEMRGMATASALAGNVVLGEVIARWARATTRIAQKRDEAAQSRDAMQQRAEAAEADWQKAEQALARVRALIPEWRESPLWVFSKCADELAAALPDPQPYTLSEHGRAIQSLDAAIDQQAKDGEPR